MIDHNHAVLRSARKLAYQVLKARSLVRHRLDERRVKHDLAALSPEDRRIIDRALPYTMTGIARLQSLVDSVRYVVHRDLPGAFVECGVWRGGSVVAMIATLQEIGAEPRDVWLYDTFEGMTEPGALDVAHDGVPALQVWHEARARGQRPWGQFFADHLFNESEVRQTVLDTGYPPERVHFVRGPVEATLPDNLPQHGLALLRLDTDWYASTIHELEHLYPHLQTGGVMIVDDYGHFEGARKAVDEYFADRPLLLHRIDYAARVAVKL